MRSVREERRRVLIASPGSDVGRLRLFGAALATLAALRIAIGYLSVPVAMVGSASVFFTVVFMALPIFALFAGAGHRWDLRQAIAVVVLGVAIQVGGTTLSRMAVNPAAGGVLFALAQTGLIVWCMGVGAALAGLMKDRNMLLPIAVFLALFDVWLVFAPEGLVNTALTTGHAPIALESVALSIPKVATSGAAPTNGYAQNLAYVGPADLLFLGMFFASLYRFGMRPRQTFLAIVPVLIVYLAVVLRFGEVEIGPIRLGALPALLPIGLTVLWINRREFRLIRDEKIITIALIVIGIPFVAWRVLATQPKPTFQHWSPPFEVKDEDLTKRYKF